MMDDELMNRFDRIEDLPVSEEMLGAFVENKLRGAEFDSVSEQLTSNSVLRNIFNEVIDTNVDNLIESSHPWDIYKGDYGYWELGLPPVLSSSDGMSFGEEVLNHPYDIESIDMEDSESDYHNYDDANLESEDEDSHVEDNEDDDEDNPSNDLGEDEELNDEELNEDFNI